MRCDVLDPNKTIWEVISGGDDTIRLGRRDVNPRAYIARFNFSGNDQQKKGSMVSGGERNRVHLARMLRGEANVLLLDEPTNDLDWIIRSSLPAYGGARGEEGRIMTTIGTEFAMNKRGWEKRMAPG